MEIAASSGSSTDQNMEVIQASLLRRQLNQEMRQQVKLIESASPQDDTPQPSAVGRYLDARA